MKAKSLLSRSTSLRLSASNESLETVFEKLTTAAEQRHEANKLTAEARTSVRNILNEAFGSEVTITGVDATESTRIFVEVEADMDQLNPDGLPAVVEVTVHSPEELVLTDTDSQLESPDDLKALIRHMSSEEQVIPIPTIIDKARSLGHGPRTGLGVDPASVPPRRSV